jgi:UDPglucose--hexose-1-phosphate uridylyltransferase
MQLFSQPHRRLNILTGEWILVSPQRAQRPWQGQTEKLFETVLPEYDPECYLCPGNTRAQGVRNPVYQSTFVFTNDFSALIPQVKNEQYSEKNLLVATSEPGICRVVCFTPSHRTTLPEMSIEAIRNVIDVWTEEYENLGARSEINYVQIFENKGEVMGCSNPHPHGQIWAERSIPVEPQKELQQSAAYFRKQHSCVLCDYLQLERKEKLRIICENSDFIALVPFWAVWPFETMILSQRHVTSLSEFSTTEKNSFADILKRLTTRYDNLFETPFPYSAGIHQLPTDGSKEHHVHFHIHFYPPLLRSATVKKFMVGYEMLANPQRDITAELAAERLQGSSEIHYKHRNTEKKL